MATDANSNAADDPLSARTRWSAATFVVLAVVVVALLVAGVVLAVHPLVYAFAAAAVLALAGWLRERERLAASLRGRDTLTDEAAANAREAERVQAKLDAEQRLRARVEQARRTEHDWNRDLRRKIAEMHRAHSVLGRGDGLHDLVLEVAMRLVGAEKGLVLSRADGDGDGKLDVVAYRGFDRNPADSEIAQRFADRVIERDETVREDAPDHEVRHNAPADDEIRNLVAIPIYIADDFSGVVVCANRDGGFEDLDDEVLLSLGDQAGAVLDNGRLHGELRSSYVTTVQMLADAIEAKDPFLRIHSDEVCSYVEAVLEKLEIGQREREELVFASLLHDVGKIGISERILLKPGRLTAEERSVIELHPRIGYRLVEHVPALRSMTAGILHHHERWDGEGYPSGLRGEDIPLEARIICVADCFSAMVSDRPYRAGMSTDEACAELERCAGTQFDPKIVRLFVEEVRRRPPQPSRSLSLAEALDDPEAHTRRKGDEPLLGYGPAGSVDSLTLLYTRRHAHQAASAESERAAVQGTPFAVVFVRLDELEAINSEQGWVAGDERLRTAAAAVQDAAATCNATACRYGGSRFVVVIPDTTRAGAEPVASAITLALADQGQTATIGLAVWEQGQSGQDVIAAAAAQLAPTRDGLVR